MKGIFAIIRGFYHNQFKCIILKTKPFLSWFYCIFRIYIKFATCSEKKVELHSLSIAEIIESEKRGYLNA